jgi:hypothetical protein
MLVVSLLNRDDYEHIELLNRREDGRIALIAQHLSFGATLVIATRSHKTLKHAQVERISRSLKTLGAERAIFIYLGPSDVSFDHVSSSKHVLLVQASDLTRWMVERGLGVSHYQTSQTFIDPDWLETLDPSLSIF